MPPCSHTINFTNFTKAAISPTPTILLRGNITNRTSCCPSTIRITTHSHDSEISEQFQLSLKTGEFKALIKLRSKQNRILVSYCNDRQTICIAYEPDDSPYIVRVFYIICKDHDGKFQSPHADCEPHDACRKIDLATELVQTIYAEKLHERGLGRRSFRVEPCELLHSDLTVGAAKGMSGEQLWEYFALEIVAKKRHRGAHEKYVAFLGCTRFENGGSSADVALGGGDLAMFGTGCLYTWPSGLAEVIARFQDDTPVDGRRYMDRSNGRGTYGGCWATSLGSLCHEIGHIFSLGHTNEGIMGGGVDHVNRVFTVDNLTADVADRMVSSGEMHTRATPRDPRLTSLKRDNRFLGKYQAQKDNDLTYFTESSAVILATHKWLNGNDLEKTNTLSFDRHGRRVISNKCPLRVIELRSSVDALVKMSVIFEESDEIKTYTIPRTTDLDSIVVYVMDVDGNHASFTYENEL